ncbi:hypothetical protein, partial [Eubacterium sp.]
MKKRIFSLIFILFILTVTGCEKKESDTRTFLNSKQSTETQQSQKNDENDSFFESNITLDFMKKRYPEKEILIYMYADTEMYINQYT